MKKIILLILIGLLLVSVVSASYLIKLDDKIKFKITDKEEEKYIKSLDKDKYKEYKDKKKEDLKKELETYLCYDFKGDTNGGLYLEISPDGLICSSPEDWETFFNSEEWKSWE